MWAGVQQVDAYGTSPSGATVYCAAVTRLPTRDPDAGALTLGHFILFAAGDWVYVSSFTEAGKPFEVATPTHPVADASVTDPAFDVVRYEYNAYGTATLAGVPGAGWPNKTGMYVTGATLTPQRIAEIRTHLPVGFKDVPIVEVRP